MHAFKNISAQSDDELKKNVLLKPNPESENSIIAESIVRDSLLKLNASLESIYSDMARRLLKHISDDKDKSNQTGTDISVKDADVRDKISVPLNVSGFLVGYDATSAVPISVNHYKNSGKVESEKPTIWSPKFDNPEVENPFKIAQDFNSRHGPSGGFNVGLSYIFSQTFFYSNNNCLLNFMYLHTLKIRIFFYFPLTNV